MKTDSETRLCFRCERRAEFLETGRGPRHECKQADAVGNCYAYLPVKPLVMKRPKGERRPVGGPMLLSARIGRVKIADVDLKIVPKNRGKFILYWEPKS